MEFLAENVLSRRIILFVLPTDTFGGAERVTFNIMKGLDEFEPVLLTQKRMNDFYSSLALRIFNFEAFNCLYPDISLKTMFAYSNAIKDVSKIVRPSIIFGVMHFASLFTLLARDLCRCMRKVPVVTSVHGTYSSHFKSMNRRPTIKENLLINYLLKRSKNIIVPSSGIKSDIMDSFRVHEKKFRVIYNGFDLDWIRECGSEELDFEKNCPWLITVARLGPPKDFDTLLHAFKIVRDRIKTKLLIVGEGPYEQIIKEKASELGLNEDVIMLGFQKNPFKYISRSDVFILSSLSEGLPGALIEAMILGIPVVSTDCPSGPAEIIKNNKSGILVAVGDADGLASASLSILGNEKLQKQFSQAVLERAADFSMDRMKREYNEYFVQLVPN